MIVWRAVRSGWGQAVLAVLLFALALFLIWWRGPDWGSVLEAFRLVVWSWIVLAFLLNVVSTLFRALSWRLTIGQALPEKNQPKLIHVLSAFGVGLFANAALPGRLGELARVATLRRHLPDAPPGTTAILVGTVIAHRLFDIVPATILVIWVLATAEVPHWAVVAILIVAGVGFALFTVAWLGARRHHRPMVRRGHGQRAAAARHGPRRAVRAEGPRPARRRDPPAVPRLAHAAVRGVGRDEGVRHRRAAPRGGARARAHEHRDDRPALARQRRPRPGGRRDPAAERLRRRRYATGFAYGLALQALEMACGVGLGLLALAREGISLAVLRRMQDDEEDSSENAVEEVHELERDIEESSEQPGRP